MKGCRKLLAFFTCIVLSISAFAQSWPWARSPLCSSPNAYMQGWLIKNDTTGNIFTAATTNGDTICLGTYSFGNTHKPTGTQTIIAKYNSAGGLLWAKASSYGSISPIAITTDASGSLYMLGVFSTDTAAFGNDMMINPHFDTLHPQNNDCYFVMKYDAAGNVLWTSVGDNIYTGYQSLSPGGIAVDGSGNSYITASFRDSAFSVGGNTLLNTDTTGASSDIFMACYDAAGNIQWLKKFNGAGDDRVYALAIGNNNTLYLTGSCGSPSVSFGSVTLTNAGAFLTATDLNGNVQWAKGSVGQAMPYCITTDEGGEIYIGGQLGDNIVSFGADTFYNANTGFVVEYDADGNVLLHKDYNGQNANVWSVATDICGNFWASGSMSSGSLMHLDTSVLHAPLGSDPLFMVEYSKSGVLMDHLALPSGGDQNSGLVTDKMGMVYMAAHYKTSPFVLDSVVSLNLNDGASQNFMLAEYEPQFTCYYPCDTIVLPDSIYTCRNSSALFNTALKGPDSLVSAYWIPRNNLSDPQSLISIIYLDGMAGNTEYTVTAYVRVADGQECIISDSTHVIASDSTSNIHVSVTGDTTLCSGQTVQLFATGAATYLWAPLYGLNFDYVPNPLMTPAVPTTYFYMGRDGKGCTYADSVRIDVYPVPDMKITSSGTVTCTDPKMQLFATGADSYAWGEAGYMNDASSSSPIVFPPVTMYFTVLGKNDDGCVSDDSILVDVNNKIYCAMPTAFTPNNDGTNDKISPIPLCDFVLDEFCIYNRWGNKVFDTKVAGDGWDGAYKGIPQATGIFSYYVKGHTETTQAALLYKGNFILIR